jgi:hypothetical protein
VSLVNNLLKDEAMEVYRDFAASGALVYNGRGGG